MLKRTTPLILVILAGLMLFAAPAAAHFQVLIPDRDIVVAGQDKTIELNIVFTHPMTVGPAMEMGAPKAFGVLAGGQKTDLLPSLTKVKVQGKTAYTAHYKIKAPADYVFYLEPAAYWEPAEEKMIIHYTKVIVDAFDAGEGWDEPVGFPVEIEPLTRPYGLWTGNVFQGLVRKNGHPVPFAEVEVEMYNTPGYRLPADAFTTQVIKADGNGVFTYAIPKAGWWAFAALIDGDEQMTNPDGKLVDVELGGLIWVRTVDMVK